MSESYFRRTGGPISLNIGGKKTLVNKNDVVFGSVSYLSGLPGFVLDETNTKPKVSNKVTPQFEELTSSEDDTMELKRIEDLSNKLEQMQKRIQETPPKPSLVELEEKPKEQIPPNINWEALKPLTKLTNKEWFKFKLVELKQYMDSANISYAHLNQDRHEYARFLKTILKENAEKL